MSTHRMHLRGPWQYELLDAAGAGLSAPDGSVSDAVATRSDSDQFAEPIPSSPSAGTARMPIGWRELLGDYRGTARFQRRFHSPTNLDPHEIVYLVFDGAGGTLRVALNGQVLGTLAGTKATGEFEITSLLKANNLLLVEVEYRDGGADAAPGGLWAPVALEIRSE